MAGFTFTPATQEQARLRLALDGPAGSGKTFTALRVAVALGRRVALVDTERGSASKYANLFSFDALNLSNFNPENYVGAIRAAEEAGYDVLVIDSLSHAWMGEGGALQMVDQAAKRSQSGNSFAAWRDVTPIHNKLVDAMLGCKCHLIVTMRSKTEWVVEKDERSGKSTPRKIGMAPIQRDGMEYEFDVVGDLDQAHNLIISKSRCPEVDSAVISKPGEDFAKTLLAWLGQGEAPKATPVQPAEAPPAVPVPTPRPDNDPPCDPVHFNKAWHGAVGGTPLASDEKRHEYVLAFTKKQWPSDPLRQVASLTTFLKGDPEHGCPPAAESEANALIAALEKSLQQRRTAEQAQRIDEKTAPSAEKSKARRNMETDYAILMRSATELGIDLAPFEIDSTISDATLSERRDKLAAAVSEANTKPRQEVAP
jgi:hypothetical protein